MTDIEVLQECRLATMEERALSRQIDRLALIGGPRGVSGQAIEPAGDRKTNNATAGKMQQLEGLIDRLVQRRNENINIIQRAETVIEKIRNRRERLVIRCYYVEGESDYEIAKELDTSQATVNQMRNRVLEDLNMQKRKR